MRVKILIPGSGLSHNIKVVYDKCYANDPSNPSILLLFIIYSFQFPLLFKLTKIIIL